MTCHVARWVQDLERRSWHSGRELASNCVLAELDAAEARSTARRRRVCVVCARPISPERLLAMPTARLCEDCQEIPRLAVGW